MAQLDAIVSTKNVQVKVEAAVLTADNEVKISCPNCDVPGVVGSQDSSAKCADCQFFFCTRCRNPAHTGGCIFKQGQSKQCPQCRQLWQKKDTGGPEAECNRMTVLFFYRFLPVCCLWFMNNTFPRLCVCFCSAITAMQNGAGSAAKKRRACWACPSVKRIIAHRVKSGWSFLKKEPIHTGKSLVPKCQVLRQHLLFGLFLCVLCGMYFKLHQPFHMSFFVMFDCCRTQNCFLRVPT